MTNQIKPKYFAKMREEAKPLLLALNDNGFEVKDNQQVFFLLLNDTPLGYIALEKSNPTVLELKRIFVSPLYRRQKVGHYLLKFLEITVKTKGFLGIIVFSPLEFCNYFAMNGFKNNDGEVVVINGVQGLKMQKELVMPFHRKAKNRRPF